MSNDTIVGWMAAFIGSLGVLFAVGAIFAGYMVYRQGQDFRRTLDDTILSYKSLLQKSINDANQRVETLSQTVSGQIAGAKLELERAGTEDRRRIDAEITRLTDLRSAVELARYTGVIEAENFVIGGPRKPDPARRIREARKSGIVETSDSPARMANGIIMCKRCGELFSPDNVAMEPPSPIRCPYCGESNSWLRG